MACSVTRRSCVGISCGRKCAICAILFSILCFLLSVGFSLAARIYYKAYYTSAHVAAICALTSLFTFSHHVFHIQSALCCSYRGFAVIQTILNTIYLICCIVLCIGYSLLSVISANYNFDYIASAGWAGLSVVLLFYMCALTVAILRHGHSSDYELDDDKFVWQSDTAGLQSDLTVHSSTADLTKKDYNNSKQRRTCAQCCSACCKVIFGLLYGMFHIIVIILFVASAAKPIFLALDFNDYRDDGELYNINIDNHYTLALSLKCIGSGNSTVLMEGDTGATYNMYREYLPKYLSENFRICMYNRRGYGFSDTFENDDIVTDLEAKKWLKDTTLLLHELVKEANIRTPFIHVSHGYGSLVSTQFALDYPDLVNGLVFIDAKDAMEPTLEYGLLERSCNLNSFSAMEIFTRTEWVNVTQYLPILSNFKQLSKNLQNEIYADLRQSYYFPTYRREKQHFSKLSIRDIVGRHSIDKPIIVIDASCVRKDWISSDQFPQYNFTLHHASVRRASHEELIAVVAKGTQPCTYCDVGNAIQSFIRDIDNVTEQLTELQRIDTCDQ